MVVSGYFRNCVKNIFLNFIVCFIYKFYKIIIEKECEIKEKYFILLYKLKLNVL